MKKLLFTKILDQITKEKLSDFEVTELPFIRIEYVYPTDVPISNQFIISSLNGCEALLNVFSVEFLKEYKFWVVGEKSAHKLRQLGLKVKFTAEDAQKLSEVLMQQNQSKWVYFCGNRRRDTLIDTLSSTGFKVQEMIGYYTHLTPVKIQANDYDGLVFFSPSGVESFLQLNDFSNHHRVFALGKTTKEAIQSTKKIEVFSPHTPTMEALVTLIKQTFHA